MTEKAKAIRDRDELWCRCLCATLDPHEIADVLEAFNSARPDKKSEHDGGYE